MKWRSKPAAHDYPAANSYLSLLVADPMLRAELVAQLQPLSPVLLVRGDLVRGFPLQVADGYHRVCASHLVDEDTDIPCRLIDLPAAEPAAVSTRPRDSGSGEGAPINRVPAKKVAATR